jgi:hypothetical protein
MRCISWKSTDVSEKRIASIFKVEEESEQETGVKTGGKQLCSASSWTLKMEAISSSETSVDFQLTTRSYIPEDMLASSHENSEQNRNVIIYS